MKVAVEGCAHGELEKIYETIQEIEKSQKIKIDLLLCCGDFQSTRNVEDLQTMAVPEKYQNMCSFYKYYSGELVAPMLTIFIGGNHEASNYLQELPYGGWVAPKIYYLGYAGVVRVNGLRIAGLSGIYKGHDYLRGRHEFPPYTDATRRSVYHVRQLEVFRLKQLSGSIDIFLSHDWPQGIYNYGNKEQLVKFKPHFRDEVDTGRLGSRPCADLLEILQPSFWFAAHLHCKFAALVPHQKGDDDSLKPERFTKFLALDKCLPKRRFLQIVDIDSVEHTDDNSELRFEYDLEWLSILALTNHLVNVKNTYYYLPNEKGSNDERYNFTPSPEEMQNVRKKFDCDLRIPENFCRTVEPYDGGPYTTHNNKKPKAVINPQSVQFCETLGIDDPVSLAMIIGGQELNYSSPLDSTIDSSFNDSSYLTAGDHSSPHVPCSAMNASGGEVNPLKRKSRLELVLPKPLGTESTQDGPSNPDELPLLHSSDDEPICAEPLIEGNAEQEKQETSTVNPVVSPIKRLKRRNQDIYQTNDDWGSDDGHT